MISALKKNSIEAPTLNMLFSSSSLGPTNSTTTINVMVIEFSLSKHNIERRKITLTSYLDAN
jgi:hypothetical protein